MGYVTALAMKKPYTELIEKTLLPQLGMSESFIDVPWTPAIAICMGL